ncbi:MAG TPA: SRPBCC family protein [Candidatus Limnocylindria bacterium]
MTAPRHVYEVYIRTTPERLWQAITDPAMTQIYYFGSRVDSDFGVGSPITYRQADGRLDIEGTIVEADPPRRLVHTFAVKWDATVNDAPTRVSWEITPMGETCRLSVVHDGFASETATYEQTGSGWAMILSGLKTLIETGEALPIGAPEAEAAAPA